MSKKHSSKSLLLHNCETHTKNKENKKLQIKNANEENIKLQNEIENIKQEIEKVKSKVENSGEHIEKLKQERIQKNEKLSKKEDEQTVEFKTIEDLKAQITKIEIIE